MILDTTFLIDLLKNDAGAAQKAKELFNSCEDFFITPISVFELWQGEEDLADKRKKDKILELLTSIGHLDFDFSSAKLAGKIYRELRNKGQLVQAEDTMIAGIALQHNEAVLTRNTKDFSKIGGLRVESY